MESGRNDHSERFKLVDLFWAARVFEWGWAKKNPMGVSTNEMDMYIITSLVTTSPKMR